MIWDIVGLSSYENPAKTIPYSFVIARKLPRIRSSVVRESSEDQEIQPFPRTFLVISISLIINLPTSNCHGVGQKHLSHIRRFGEELLPGLLFWVNQLLLPARVQFELCPNGSIKRGISELIYRLGEVAFTNCGVRPKSCLGKLLKSDRYQNPCTSLQNLF
jgi:hypothetical protein